MSLDIACQDSICALSTPQGYGALAIVRISGPLTMQIFSQIFRKHKGDIEAMRAMHGAVISHDGSIIDDVMALLFKGKNSFTGEDSAEIHCHGNPLIIDQIIERVCSLGARLAKPGEFSMRSVLNGKIDLVQAESIADLIHAETTAAKEAALQGVRGGLADKTKSIKEMIISVLAEMEARMDFPDEELGSYDKNFLLGRIDEGVLLLKKLLDGADYGIKLHEGARIVICGLPNAGKSTLLNQLSGQERAIVHDSAGTTRDVLEARIDLDGVPVVLVDVAGIREVDLENDIEKIGIDKALDELDKAHAVIWLGDGGSEHPFSDVRINEKLKDIPAPLLYVLNKSDVALKNSSDVLTISAKYGHNIDELKRALKKMIVKETTSVREIYVTRARQREELNEALNGLKESYRALELSLVDEVVASELRRAGLAFERLFGMDLSESVLDTIFSQFCIGK
ncbi:MAG: tRNA uridine-5-carboxymethylaminomethyl(34) synthesis GTPase MnmE [Myxococcales bacterium]|nr:tRNA uridine-5-carboxymethylaminomethyl(34) synthesis GTPase MnmE [Myxococcales bacterium]USN51766.1 MAG: tRNA uridine-5-carboxymethylaminomethyl(34) synthesis GTPase MnmE [Myxococcales bacterium]